MASSKVMSSTSPANSDLPRDSSSSINALTSAAGLFQSDRSRSFGSMNMDDYELFKNIYSDPEDFPNARAEDGGGSELAVDGRGSRVSMPKRGGSGKTAEEVWNEILAGGVETRGGPTVTLEDFLTKAGAVTEEDVRIPAIPPPPPPLSFGESLLAGAHFPVAPVHMQQPIQTVAVDPVGFGNGRMVGVSSGGVGSGGGGGGGVRGKRRAVEDQPLDKATQQKQRRMIKNRESAARSRERKQVHTTELEYMVRQLEDENEKLLMEEAELSRQRYMMLMENLIPVEEKRRPPRGQALRRVNSLPW